MGIRKAAKPPTAASRPSVRTGAPSPQVEGFLCGPATLRIFAVFQEGNASRISVKHKPLPFTTNGNRYSFDAPVRSGFLQPKAQWKKDTN